VKTFLILHNISGPNTGIYQENYFQSMKEALRPGGIISIQAGSAWLSAMNPGVFVLPKLTYDHCKKIFGNAEYASLSVPSFPSGQIGIVVATSNLVSNDGISFPKPELDMSLSF